MVRSGEDANINVGQEVPIITSQGTSPDLQTSQGSAILQSVQYRKTGVSLSVKPVVYSESQIDLKISQSSSSAEANGLSSVPSPIISNRSINTSLSLADGGSVLLGGLISTNKTIGNTGIPLLKDIPILGHLFRSDSESITRTELVMLIIPYVLNNSQQAEDITKAFRDKISIIEPEQPQPDFQPPAPTIGEPLILEPVEY
jgi:general secretion pathway protein D